MPARFKFSPVTKRADMKAMQPLIRSRSTSLVLTLLLLGACLPANTRTGGDDPARPEIPPGATEETAIDAWYDGDSRLAVRIYEHLLERDPENSDLRHSLVILLREKGDLERALAVAATLEDDFSHDRLMTRVLAGVPLTADRAERDRFRDDEDPRVLFWLAVDEMLNGTARGAEALFAEVIDLQGHAPHAHLFRGLIARNRRDWTATIEHLTRALRQDGNLTPALQPLAEARYSRGETQQAWDLIARAAIAMPWNEEVRDLHRRWEAERPDLVAARQAAAERRRVVAEPPVVAVAPVEREAIPRVRVGLAEGLTSIYLKTGGPFRVVTVPDDLAYYGSDDRLEILQEVLSSAPVARGERGMVLKVETGTGGDLVIRAVDESDTGDSSTGSVLARGTGPFRLVYENPRDTSIVFDLAYGHGQFSAGREDRSYRGDMEFVLGLAPGPVDRFTLINDVNVEEYLYSVVPSEMPASWPDTALQAQAVAARSYTLHRRTRFHPRGFDLLGSVTSAYYSGVTGEHSRTTRAVDATRGLVLRDGRGTLDAVYSANNAGYTESSESVWGFATSLVAVADPHLPPLDGYRSPAEVYRWILDRPESYSWNRDYASAGAYRWSLIVAREDIERRLAAAGLSVGSVRRVVPGARGITGRVETVRVEGTDGEAVVNRDAIRSRLGGLRSNLFVVSPRYAADGDHPSADSAYLSAGGDADGDVDAADTSNPTKRLPAHFYFEGAGWGHGVGMCQTGAAGMAAEGFSVEEILAHYYPRNEQVLWY